MEIQINKNRIQFFKSNLRKLKSGKGLVLGAGAGKSAQEILSSWPGTVFLLDRWSDGEEDSMLQTLGRINSYGDRAVLMRAGSEKVGDLFGSSSLDFVYLDGVTSYEKVKEELKRWMPKIKPGGTIGGFGFLNSNLQSPKTDSQGNHMVWNEDGIFLGYFGVEKALRETVGLRFDIQFTSEPLGSWFVTLD